MRAKKKPAYCLHKGSGQARIIIAGKSIYLGEYGSPDSRQQYDEIIAEWFERRNVSRCTLLVEDLALLFLAHAEQHYQKNGQLTSELGCIRTALRHLLAECGRLRVRQFSPLKLKAARARMINDGWARNSINTHVGRIRQMFRWGVENELVPVDVFQSLCTVRGLQAGCCKAFAPAPIFPVDDHIEPSKRLVLFQS